VHQSGRLKTLDGFKAGSLEQLGFNQETSYNMAVLLKHRFDYLRALDCDDVCQVVSVQTRLRKTKRLICDAMTNPELVCIYTLRRFLLSFDDVQDNAALKKKLSDSESAIDNAALPIDSPADQLYIIDCLKSSNNIPHKPVHDLVFEGRLHCEEPTQPEDTRRS
jgi:hypothetical protein